MRKLLSRIVMLSEGLLRGHGKYCEEDEGVKCGHKNSSEVSATSFYLSYGGLCVNVCAGSRGCGHSKIKAYDHFIKQYTVNTREDTAN